MKKISDNVYEELNESQKIEVNDASDKIAELIKNGSELTDEGLIGGIIGGLTGATIGPSIGIAICKVLGIEKGMLYNLFTSRMFTAAVAAQIGYKI